VSSRRSLLTMNRVLVIAVAGEGFPGEGVADAAEVPAIGPEGHRPQISPMYTDLSDPSLD